MCHGIATMHGLHNIARGNPLSKIGKAGIMAGDDTTLKELHTLIEELDRRIAACDVRCGEIAKHEPLVPILTSMPGIGIVSALIGFQLEHHSGYHIALEWDISGDMYFCLIFQGGLRTSPCIPHILANPPPQTSESTR
jgi:hypothetical protein